jgi:hypothetical protein
MPSVGNDPREDKPCRSDPGRARIAHTPSYERCTRSGRLCRGCRDEVALRSAGQRSASGCICFGKSVMHPGSKRPFGQAILPPEQPLILQSKFPARMTGDTKSACNALYYKK